MSHAALRRQAQKHHSAKLHRLSGGHVDEAADKKLIVKAIREHENADHGGKHSKLKLESGGVAENRPAAPRLDRPGRAKGGRTGKKAARTHVNVIVAPQGGGGGGGMPPGLPPHPPMMGGPPPGPPPGMPPGLSPAGGPPGAPPMVPHPPVAGPPVGAGVPGMRARGGRTNMREGGMDTENAEVSPSSKAGSKSGVGRLDKAAESKHERMGENVAAVGGMRRGGTAKK